MATAFGKAGKASIRGEERNILSGVVFDQKGTAQAGINGNHHIYDRGRSDGGRRDRRAHLRDGGRGGDCTGGTGGSEIGWRS